MALSSSRASRIIKRSKSLPPVLTSGASPSFYPTLPRVRSSTPALMNLLRSLGEEATSCVLDKHTHMSLARVRWNVTSRNSVSCVSVQNIVVEKEYRLRGHARRALRALSRVAADSRLILVAYNVVSTNMHALVRNQLDGRCLPESGGCGFDGCSYWIPQESTHRALYQVDVQAPYGLPPFRLGVEVRPEPQHTTHKPRENVVDTSHCN